MEATKERKMLKLADISKTELPMKSIIQEEKKDVSPIDSSKKIDRYKMANVTWTEKYRPQILSDVVGHPTVIEELKDWALSWEEGPPKNRALLLQGDAGIGKTTSAYALANDMGWEVTELNASDQRTAHIIEKIAGSASQMQTLSGTKKLIIMDEADNIHGTADRGGEKAIIGVIKKTNQPIILLANELYDMSPGLRSACRLIKFKSVSISSIILVLKKITKSEHIIYDTGVLEKIAENANGDLRGAINDLQAISQGKVKVELRDIVTGERDIKENIFKALEKIFKGKDIRAAYMSSFDVDEDPEGFIQWIDENLPYEYIKRQDLDQAYKYLSDASLFLSRVKIRQNYNMWRYATVLMTAGMVVARSQKYMGFVKFQTPTIRKTLGQTKRTRSIRDSIAKKVGDHCHVSMRFSRSQLFPFIKLMMKNEKYASAISASLTLLPEEIAYLIGSEIDTDIVKKIYNSAQSFVKEETEYDIELFGGFGRGHKEESEDIYIEDEQIQTTNNKKEDNKKKSGGEKTDDKSQKSLFDF